MYEKEIEILQKWFDTNEAHVLERHPADPFYPRALARKQALDKAIQALRLCGNLREMVRFITTDAMD